jgi:hypothetical protein
VFVQELDANRNRFILKHLMAGTFFLSLSLGGARWVLPPGDTQWSGTAADLISLAMFTVVNLLVVVPFIWAAFLQRRRLAAFLIGRFSNWPLF